jgi:hypothetical protein
MTEQAGGGQDDRNSDQRRDESAGSRGSPRSGQSRSRQSTSGDMISDFQRWLIRSSAKSMRKEIGGQVRRTFGTGRSKAGDVWDTATTEIPPEVGEAPECQWCPICRAARRMRESSPDIGGHLSTAGDVVAAAVQDALSAFDAVLARSGSDSGNARSARRDDWAADPDGWATARDQWAMAHGAIAPEHGEAADTGQATQPAEAPGTAEPGEAPGAPEAGEATEATEAGGATGATEAGGATEATEAGGATGATEADSRTVGNEEISPWVVAQDMTDEPDGSDEPDDRG